jgi:hypothetical protein
MANVDMLTKASLGQYGSAYVPASTTFDLTGSTATRYISAIQIITDESSFSALEALDGAVGFVSTVTAEIDLDDAATGIGAAANGTTIASIALPKGTIIYGKWDKLTTASSSTCIVYLAPRGF